jgi:hypothetical protein
LQPRGVAKAPFAKVTGSSMDKLPCLENLTDHGPNQNLSYSDRTSITSGSPRILDYKVDQVQVYFYFVKSCALKYVTNNKIMIIQNKYIINITTSITHKKSIRGGHR